MSMTYDPTQQMNVPTGSARVVTNVTQQPGKPTYDAATTAIIEQIKKLFPNFSFVFDSDAGGFGDDLRDLLLRAVRENYTNDRFDLEFAQTRYAKETDDLAKAFDKQTKAERDADIERKYSDILAEYADVFADDKEARKIAARAARLGLTGNRLKNFVYASVVQAGGAARVSKTSDADELRLAVRSYGYMPDDEEINAALAGTSYKGQVFNKEVLVGKAKAAAKGQYGHLASQIDAGLTLDDIFKNYRTYAAEILELDPNTIDYRKDPKWAEAFGNAKDGQLSLSDWVTKLKTDSKYGWRFTNQANQQVSSVASTLERAFGLIK